MKRTQSAIRQHQRSIIFLGGQTAILGTLCSLGLISAGTSVLFLLVCLALVFCLRHRLQREANSSTFWPIVIGSSAIALTVLVWRVAETNQSMLIHQVVASGGEKRADLMKLHGNSAKVILAIGLVFSAILTVLSSLWDKALRTNRRLEESDERFRLLIDGAKNHAILMIDPNGYISSWSEGARRITGYSAEEILGRHFSIFYTKQDNEIGHYAEELSQALANGRFEEEGPRLRKDGSAFCAQVTITPIFDREGQHRGFSKVTHDISEHKAIEARLKLALETSGIGVWDWDISQNSLVWDSQMYKLYDVKPDEFTSIYDAWLKRLHPEDKERGAREIQEALKGTKAFDTQFRVVWKHGEIRTLKGLGYVVRDDNGKPIRMLGANLDITEIKSNETLALARLEEAEAANQRFELVAEGSSVGIWDWMDMSSGVEYWSPKFHFLLGYAEGEIEPSIESFRNLLHPDDREATFGALAEHFTSQAAFEVEYRLRMKSGEYRWFQGSGQAAFAADGSPHRMAGSIQDIHHRKLLEEELRSVAQSRSMFLANMSHEIRTPMNGVVGMTTLLSQCELSSEASEYVEVIRKSGEVLLSLLNDILDYSKVEAGKVTLEKESFDIRDTVETVLDLFAESAAKKGLCFTGVVLPSVPREIVGDSTRLQQVLSNLVSNAIKFTELGEVAIRVSSEGIFDQNMLLTIDVLDTGIGMPAEIQDQLFSPFTQGDASTTRRFGGTGLGLSISKKLIQLMGGEIEIKSNLGEGSRFRICIPFQQRQISPAPFLDFGRFNIGVLTSNPFLESAIVEILTLKRNAPVVIESLEELALRGKDLGSFDVIIVDSDARTTEQQMVLAAVEEEIRASRLNLVYLVSRGGGFDSSQQGVSFVRKPIKQSQLLRAIAKATGIDSQLEGRRVRPEYHSKEALLNRFGKAPLCLVAEDNSTNQKVVMRMLERLGVRCDVVGNGKEALAALQKIPYDVVLMDCFMPEMDGYEASRLIRTMPNDRCETPIVAVTGNVSEMERVRCLQNGMDAYVAKPIDFQELRETLMNWFAFKDEPAKKAA